MAVPNIFANVTTTIPLSQLDTNFATAITLGNTAVYLGNTTTALGNLTLNNVTIASGTASGNLSTGNVTVSGTLGVTGASTLAALSATTGAFSSALSTTDTTASSSATTGALKVSGGAGFAKGIVVGSSSNRGSVTLIGTSGAAPVVDTTDNQTGGKNILFGQGVNAGGEFDVYNATDNVNMLRITSAGVITTANNLAVTGTASVSSTLLVGGAPTQSYYTTVRAIALASGGTIQGFTNTGGLYMLNNVYQVASTASWTRINAEAVSGLLLESGAVQFRYAATGLAGSTVSTFITSGSIDNSGNWTFSPGGSTVGSITSTGLAVTGTLSATSIGANAQILMYPGSFNMTVGTGSVANTEKFMVASPGNAFGGIGITDTVDASNFPFITFRNAAGTGIGSISRVTTTNVVAYNTTSDYRLKNNQAPLTGSGEFIDALRPKTWEWAGNGIKAAGFVAHEFAEVSPSSVTGEKDGSREEEYEVSPAIAATTDKDGKELTPAIAAVKATRTVPVYQGMQASSSEVIANLVAELQSLRKRISQLEAA